MIKKSLRYYSINNPISGDILFPNKKIPVVFKKRYPSAFDNPIYMEGYLNIKIGGFYKLLSPFFNLFNIFPYKSQDNVPTRVKIIKGKNNDVIMKRTIYYKDSDSFEFVTKFTHYQNNVVYKTLKFGLTVKLNFQYDNNMVIINSEGYFLGKHFIPLGNFFGNCKVIEKPIDTNSVDMELCVGNSLGVICYEGRFEMTDNDDDNKRIMVFASYMAL